jgi:hypothetical protein
MNIGTPGDPAFVELNLHGVLSEGESIGGANLAIYREMIRETIREHVRKELQLREKGIKVLSLFFVDKVASYMGDGDTTLNANGDFAQWLSGLSSNLNVVAKGLSSLDQAWLMSVSAAEQAHWLDPNSWDLNKPWPLAKPDGSAMGIGTELDRVFKLIAAGQSQIIR